jgi:hypothetical protein
MAGPDQATGPFGVGSEGVTASSEPRSNVVFQGMRSDQGRLPIIDAEFQEIEPGRRKRWLKPYRGLPRIIAFAPCLVAVWACAAVSMGASEPWFRATLVVIAALQWPIHLAFDALWKGLHGRVTQEEADDLRERIIGRRGEL